MPKVINWCWTSILDKIAVSNSTHKRIIWIDRLGRSLSCWQHAYFISTGIFPFNHIPIHCSCILTSMMDNLALVQVHPGSLPSRTFWINCEHSLLVTNELIERPYWMTIPKGLVEHSDWQETDIPFWQWRFSRPSMHTSCTNDGWGAAAVFYKHWYNRRLCCNFLGTAHMVSLDPDRYTEEYSLSSPTWWKQWFFRFMDTVECPGMKCHTVRHPSRMMPVAVQQYSGCIRQSGILLHEPASEYHQPRQGGTQSSIKYFSCTPNEN